MIKDYGIVMRWKDVPRTVKTWRLKGLWLGSTAVLTIVNGLAFFGGGWMLIKALVWLTGAIGVELDGFRWCMIILALGSLWGALVTDATMWVMAKVRTWLVDRAVKRVMDKMLPPHWTGKGSR